MSALAPPAPTIRILRPCARCARLVTVPGRTVADIGRPLYCDRHSPAGPFGPPVVPPVVPLLRVGR